MAVTIKLGPSGSEKLYALKRPYVPYTPDVQGPLFRTSGVDSKSNNGKITKYTAEHAKRGIGHSRFRRANGASVGGVRDADALTLHRSGVYPAHARQTNTHVDPLEHLVRAISFKGSYLGVFEPDYTASLMQALGVGSFNSSTDTWDLKTTAPNVINTSSSGSYTTSDPSWSHTVSAGSNKCLVVIMFSGSTAARTVAGVTWNGTALTQFDTFDTAWGYAECWYLLDPEEGTYTIAVDMTSATSDTKLCTAYTAEGVNQTTPLEVLGEGYASAGEISITPTAAERSETVLLTCALNANNSITLTCTTAGDAPVQFINTAGTASFASGYARIEQDLTGTYKFDWSLSPRDSAAYCIGLLAAAGNMPVASAAIAGGIRAFDMAEHKSKAVIVTSHGEDEGAYSILSSSDGITWTEINGTGWPSASYLSTTVTRRNNYDDNMARVCSFGNTLLAALYEDPDSSGGSVSQIRIYYSTDTGTNWSAGAVIPSGSGPTALIVGRDETTVGNPATPILWTAEGLYRVDSGGTTYNLLHPLDGHAQNGRWAKVGNDGAMWAPLGSGKIIRYEIVGQNQRQIDIIEPKDGLISTRQGYAHMIEVPPEPWILVSYGGESSGQLGSVFAISYDSYYDADSDKREWPWHSMFLDDGGNIDCHFVGYSIGSDLIPRMFVGLEGSTADEVYTLEYPFRDPSDGQSSMIFKDGSYIEIPEEDFGDALEDSLLLSLAADVVGLSADDTGEVLIPEYGINGAAWDDNAEGESTFLGYLVSGDKQVEFGRTRANETGQTESGDPVGISVKTARLRVEFQIVTTTNVVQIKELQWEAKNKVETLWGILARVDLNETARLRGATVTSRTIYNELVGYYDAVPLLVLNTDDVLGERYVEMRDINPSLRNALQNASDAPQAIVERGEVEIVLEELT